MEEEQHATRQIIETFPELEIHPEVEAALRRHIVDREPFLEGKQELVRSLGNSAIGMREVSIVKDPIFIPQGHEKTWGEMSVDEQKETSMRRIALKKLEAFLK